MNTHQSIPPRPQALDEEVLKKQAHVAVDAVQKALGAAWDASQRQKAIRVLEEVISSSTDGYERSRALQDRHGWDGINSEVVIALTPSLLDLDKYLSEAVEAWVLQYGVRFPAKEGDEINYRNKANNLMRARVIGVMAGQAQALVQLTGVFQAGHPVREKVDAEQVTSVKRNSKNVRHSAFLLYDRVESGVIRFPSKAPRPERRDGELITEAEVTDNATE